MNNIEIFKSDQFGQVRTVVSDSEPWFVAKDVAEILGYSETSMMTRRLDCDEISKIKSADLAGLTAYGNNDVTIINESGLYSAIIGSKKPEAKAFKKWVTSEVLPAIRKQGGYMLEKDGETPEELMARALMIAGETLKRRDERILSLETKIELDAPKVEFFEAVADSKDAIDIGTAAKVLGIKGLGRNNLFELLRDEKILMNNNHPYQKYVDSGWFRIVEQKFNKPDGSTCINIKTLVYQKGLDGIRKVVSGHIS